jgi:hypothetical protein
MTHQLGIREGALIPEGYEVDDIATQKGWQMERLCVAICGLWWGWGFQRLVTYYSREARPMVILQMANPWRNIDLRSKT